MGSGYGSLSLVGRRGGPHRADLWWTVRSVWRAPVPDQGGARDDGAPRPPATPAALLDPALEVVPFTGREPELSDLLAWARKGRGTGVRLVTGPGGVGKTRLAVELSRRLVRSGWAVLAVPDGGEADAVTDALGLRARRVLIVVDRAESRPGLAQLLRDAAVARGTVRVLLLARTAGEWWERLETDELAVRRLLADAQAGTDLDPRLTEDQDDAAVVLAAAIALAAALGRPVPASHVVGSSGARVLDLHATALARVLGGGPGGLGDLARLLWRDDGGQAAALASLVGSAPGGDPSAGPLQPDALAEHVVVSALGGLPPGTVGAALDAAPTASVHPAFRAATLLVRAAAERSGRPDELRATVELLGEAVDRLPDDLELLTTVFGALPGRSLATAPLRVSVRERTLGLVPEGVTEERAAALRELGMALGRSGRAAEAVPVKTQAVELLRELADRDSCRFLPRLALALRDLGLSYQDVGRLEDARAVQQEAVALLRDLVEREPGVHEGHLASVLTWLGATYWELGRAEAAYAPSREAVVLLRTQVQRSPGRFLPELGYALGNLGIRLSGLGRVHEALAPTEESVQILRALARDNPDAYQSYLAAALAQLGVRLAQVGQVARAVPPTEEAVAIRRDLARSNPGYLPFLARVLSNLGGLYSVLGRTGEALSAGREAVATCRDLVRTMPERFRPELADALSNLGVTYSRLARPIEALAAEREALSVRRELAERSPGRHLPDLAASLSNLGVRYSELGRPEDALEPTMEAVTIRRRLAGQVPGRFGPDLADALLNLGATYADLNRPQDALGPTTEALAVRRILASSNPGRFGPDLAAALTNQAAQLADNRRFVEALAPAREAVELRRELVRAGHDLHRAGLARSLSVLARIGDELGHADDARRARDEAERLQPA
ncbi:tetratricopeptide repeat protein [Antribacter sp. KLBMP9083]|uniref:Tetratricopeptide repeat protein n=1 Tax=Antribacter soli TaxID=2910976 RepID=A0AA41QF11_9MICO|nr:tetratricopeptide repeat protein [Antribacter soli]MCF4121931.1 tetratricopeptide repeat protein [Antribacter soli]